MNMEKNVNNKKEENLGEEDIVAFDLKEEYLESLKRRRKGITREHILKYIALILLCIWTFIIIFRLTNIIISGTSLEDSNIIGTNIEIILAILTFIASLVSLLINVKGSGSYDELEKEALDIISNTEKYKSIKIKKKYINTYESIKGK